MLNSETQNIIKEKFHRLEPYFNEKTLRLWAACEALSLGRGGVTALSNLTALSRATIHSAIGELTNPAHLAATPDSTQRIRRRGGGRKQLTQTDSTLLRDLQSLLDPVTRGDPDSPLLWTCKSTTKLAAQLRSMGHCVSQRTVYTLLKQLEYSLQANQKSKEGNQHPDRDAQFQYICEKVKSFQSSGEPAISVDAKKKELVGEFFNKGREWCRKKQPRKVNAHDFVDKHFGKVTPYGVYDIRANQGWVSVGIDHDTAEFAVATIRRWWQEMGRELYPQAKKILVLADSGGSNGNRVRLWKVELQKLADELSMTIEVVHFPPGTSKWNKIEHRMFCHISQNWRGQPLRSRAVIVELINHTRTEMGLEIKAAIDEKQYRKGVKVSDEEFNSIEIEREEFHPEWNYKIKPRHIK